MDRFFERAEAIIAKANRDNSQLGVFMIGGKFRTAKVGGELFEKAIRQHQRHFLGVYNGICDPSHLEEDMRYISDLP